MPPDHNTLAEIYRLTRENNQMLHKMRRNALLGGVLKFVLYAVLFAAPIWFYMTYLSGTVDTLVSDMNKLEGTSQATQSKFTGFEDAVKDFESHLPAFLQAPQSTTSPQE